MISNNEFKAIAELDLDPIKVKLMHQESGEGWTLEHANMVEFEYRRFLYLMKKYPNEQTAPRFDVDIFWHYHILDTLKYAVDCETVFGYFLHHFPYVGLRGAEDEQAHRRVGARMQELYEDTFGEPYVRRAGDAASAWSAAVSRQGEGASVTAWSAAVTKPAWSAAVATTAWSAAVNQAAWSAAVSQAAAPSAAAGSAWSAAVPATAWSAAAPQQRTLAAPGFYSTRPSLAAA